MRRLTALFAADFAVNVACHARTAIFSAKIAANIMFIHEQPDWPAFRWDHEALSAPLAAVRHRQGKLFGRMAALSFDLRDEAVLRTLTEDVLTTSAIEGERLDSAQVRSSLARRLGLDAGGLRKVDRDVEGIVELMLDATRRYAAPLTRERLCGWHSSLFPGGRSGLRKVMAGTWRNDRDGPMRVVSGPVGRERVHFQAPAANRLEGEMAAFLAWFDGATALDPVLKAALAHLWFVAIHPFDDGNGRIARAIADLALARAEDSAQRFYSLSARIHDEREAYYDALESAQKGTLDVTAWLLWFLACLDRAIGRAETALALVLRKAAFWRQHAESQLNARQRKMLNRLLDGFEGKLTTAKWAAITRCSSDTALRDIGALVACGILVREAAGGRSTSYGMALGSGT